MKALYAEYEQRPEIKPYLPPKINQGRTCNKQYFWDVVNSITSGEVEAMVDHANSQRNAVDSGDMNQESITMSQQMVDLMQAHPWVSVSTVIQVTLTGFI